MHTDTRYTLDAVLHSSTHAQSELRRATAPLNATYQVARRGGRAAAPLRMKKRASSCARRHATCTLQWPVLQSRRVSGAPRPPPAGWPTTWRAPARAGGCFAIARFWKISRKCASVNGDLPNNAKISLRAWPLLSEKNPHLAQLVSLSADCRGAAGGSSAVAYTRPHAILY